MQTETQRRPFNLLSKIVYKNNPNKITRNNHQMYGNRFTKNGKLPSLDVQKSIPASKIKEMQFKYYKYRRMLKKLKLEEMPKSLDKDDSGTFR